MNNDQMSVLAAALQRAAATMRGGNGMVAPMPFGGPGMFNPTPMANQAQAGMQPTDASSFNERFGNMDPAVLAKGDMLHADPTQAIATRGMPTMAAGGVPMPQPRPGGAIAQSNMGLAPYDPNGSLSNKDANSIYDSFSASKAGQQMGMPQQAPQGMGFFQRNSAMMRDPATGQLIDPSMAAQAGSGTWGSSGGILPHVMNMMGAGTGAPGTNANGSIQGAYGPTSVGGAPLARPNQQQMGGILPRMLGLFGGMQN